MDDKAKLIELDIKIARLEERLGASMMALDLANKNLEHWKASSNEWREENTEQRNLYVTKDQCYSMIITMTVIIISVITLIFKVIK